MIARVSEVMSTARAVSVVTRASSPRAASYSSQLLHRLPLFLPNGCVHV